MGSAALPKIGPCQVLFGTAGSEIDLGFCKSATFHLTESRADVVHSQTGVEPYDQVISGRGVTVEVEFTEPTYALLQSLLPVGTNWTPSGPTPLTGVSNEAFEVRLGLGMSARDNAQSLVIKPYVDGVPSTNQEDWITVPVASPGPELEWVFDATTQRVTKGTFRGFPVSAALPRIVFLGRSTDLPLV